MEKNRIYLDENTCVGQDSPTAINVLIGANCEEQNPCELKKIDILNDSKLPISIVTDLSIYRKQNDQLWRHVVKDSRFIAGTVPVYQAVDHNKTIAPTYLLDIICEQAEGGVKLITIHPTADYELLKMSRSRLVPITSRGGAAVSIDMLVRHSTENVYTKILDKILKVALIHNITISIGSSFRSANIQDAMDDVYLKELEKQLTIAEYCNNFGVNTIIETPGHASPQKIFSICDILNTGCHYPIMPLGPLPTDCAFEQDDLAAVVGAVLMGTRNCADILSVITRDEHIGGIPTIESIFSAVIKYLVAKHVIDFYKIIDLDMDNRVSAERSKKHSCIFEDTQKCDRCDSLCPLSLSKELKNSWEIKNDQRLK